MNDFEQVPATAGNASLDAASTEAETFESTALDAATTPAASEIAAATRLGAVHLTISDLQRSVAYYRQGIGLELLEADAGHARLGTGGKTLLVLQEEAGAGPGFGYTGLYHFALLLPQRRDLAGWLAHARREGVALTGFADHFVSEAIYLSDPDGHGIEIYWDRPRELWEGQVAERMTSLPLDVQDLLGLLVEPSTAAFAGLPAGTVMGHVHLKVASIPEAVAFYRDVIGFPLMAQLGRQAAFFGAGGYHHHLGANSWESAGAGPPPPGVAALRQLTLVLPDRLERDRVLSRLDQSGYSPRASRLGPLVDDPSGNTLLLALA